MTSTACATASDYTYTYIADSSGTVTLKSCPINNANQTGHVYGFSQSQRRERQRRSHHYRAAAGTHRFARRAGELQRESLTAFRVPTYQWRFNGTNISGAQASSYTITGTSRNGR